jgi:hypothetical protein
MMGIEFSKVMTQITKMGSMIEKLDFDLDNRLELATHIFEASGDLNEVYEHIRWIRQPDVSGYRGAAPLELKDAEPVNLISPAPEPPEHATILATDGSQIYPDEQAPVHYYLLNMGLYVYHHGTERIPEAASLPRLEFHQKYVHDRYGGVIRNSTVDDRRTVAEMRTLAEAAWERKRQGEPQPLITFYDNRLMYLPSNEGYGGEDLLTDYIAAMVQLHDAGASLVGYIDNPYRSKRFMQLLFLMTLESGEEVAIRQRELSRTGPLEGLHDQQFFDYILKPGERSAIMVQNSPQNYEFKARGENYEIAFFYLKVTNQERAINSDGYGFTTRVVRVDLPVWVARDRDRVDAVHSIILSQCQLQGRNPYPYVLTRADELAYVSAKDKEKIDQLVRVEIRKAQNRFDMDTITAKERGKELARGDKRYHEM